MTEKNRLWDVGRFIQTLVQVIPFLQLGTAVAQGHDNKDRPAGGREWE